MAINVYTGLMGSGKSYEVVSEVIIAAIRTGRRVVTNIDGIDADAILAYAADKFGMDYSTLGRVVKCENSDVERLDFLPHGDESATFCVPGDLIAIDEAWRFWGHDKKLSNEHKIFFREHRHFVHPENKISCDLVLMVQDIADLHRYLRHVVEMTFRTVKLKAVGMPTRYRIEVYEGHKLTKTAHVSTLIKKYNPEIFPLYSSYAGGQGKEVVVDDRQSIFHDRRIWVVVAILVALVIVSVVFLKRFFSGGAPGGESRQAKDGGTLATTQPANLQGDSFPASSPSAPSQSFEFSDKWRVVGFFDVGDEHYVFLLDEENRVRHLLASGFRVDGLRTAGQADGVPVTMFSGTSKARQ